VLRQPRNRGKGAAVKTGFRYLAEHHADEDVVCADSDGQHSVPDVLRVAERVRSGEALVLGVRRFGGPVPVRSRVSCRPSYSPRQCSSRPATGSSAGVVFATAKAGPVPAEAAPRPAVGVTG
jgi:hypothetical protein